jgi:fructose-1-phosphate kinase PfkB-like protein
VTIPSLLFQIVFESESASTVAIAKENVTRMANYRRIQLEETVSAEDSSVASFLSLVSETCYLHFVVQ